MSSGPHILIKKGRPVNYQPPFTNFDQFLKLKAKDQPKKPALIFADFLKNDSISLSYNDLNHLTAGLAHTLLTRFNLKPGDRLSFAFPNTPEILILNYAAWRVGLVTVPLDVTRDTIDRKVYKLKFARCKLFFTQNTPAINQENSQIRTTLPQLKIITTNNFADFKQKLIPDKKILNTKYPIPHTNVDADCLILFTSGTTALPKGVRLSLKSLFANAQSIATWLKFNQKDRFHILIPLHHINSTTFVNTTLVASGTIILSPRYSKSNFWKIMAKYKATGASIVPTIAYDLLSETASFKTHQKNMSQVRRIQIGSAPVQPQVVKQFIAQYRIPLVQGYGQTETSLRSTGVPMDLKPPQSTHIRQLNSLGCELKYTNVTILDETGRELPEGKQGEICVRGPIIMPGYLNNPQANQEAFAFNWFHSGDTGYFKTLYNRKFFFLKGRTKEIIHKGGVLISPLAIENALLAQYRKLDKIYAVGFPHRRLGQEIGLIAITQTPKVVAQVLKAAKTGKLKGLNSYEYPRAALVVSETDLPKTSTGKIQRLKIKDVFGQKLLQQYRTLAQTKKLNLRLLGPEETSLLKQALTINNHRWGKHLKSTLKEFTARARAGILIAALDQKNQVLGTVAALKLNQKDLQLPKNQTWDGLTGQGTLSTHKHKGNTLLCVAISTKSKTTKPKIKTKTTKPQLTPKDLTTYLKSSRDPIITFHRKPKGGLKTGAQVIKAIKNSRPQDHDSLGYNVLMHYPTPDSLPKVNSQSSIGTQLIEAALLYAYSQKLERVYVYTRPTNLSQHFSQP